MSPRSNEKEFLTERAMQDLLDKGLVERRRGPNGWEWRLTPKGEKAAKEVGRDD